MQFNIPNSATLLSMPMLSPTTAMTSSFPSDQAARVSPSEMDIEPTPMQSGSITGFVELTEEQRDRARRRWDFVKHVATGGGSSNSRGFKMGERVSLTTAEAKFLSMMTKAMVESDHAKYAELHNSAAVATGKWGRKGPVGVDKALRSVAANLSIDNIDGEKRGGVGTQVFHVVKAAVAKERMRNSIARRLSELSGPEVRFLTALVNSEDVTLEELENAIDILDNDPMYNPSLREKDEHAPFAVHGDEENEQRRRIALERQSSSFDASLPTRNEKGTGIHSSHNGQRSQPRRRSSAIEASVWKDLSAGTGKALLDESSRSHQSIGKGKRNESLIRTSIRNGNDLDEFDFSKSALDTVSESNVDKPYTFHESASTVSTRHVKRLSSKAGEAIDPLLSAIPVEMNDDDEDMFCCSENSRKESSHPKKRTISSNGRVDIGMMLLRPFLCCGMDRIDLKTEEKTKEDEEEDFESLESKKRYLHLQNTAALTTNLSTWLGSPEDFPILGLEKINADGTDPLDPHVLSPLLMKCLRDHLPYALKEENFWLKYSLVRDGASLETVFKSLRHSQHTVLAIETTRGVVFGSFTSHPWRCNGNKYYGSCDAFVWNLRRKREQDNCLSLDEYILRESTLDVFPWASEGGNRNVQLSNSNKLFVGGGEPDDDVFENVEKTRDENEEKTIANNDGLQWGMALALDKDLLYGTSSRCATFDSDPMVQRSSGFGSQVFEIMNMEIWTLTPCMTEELAENLELGRTFVMGLHKK
ncbi:hypothetical protein HJC23_009835 [Cyclotella cryptica]|uniref:Oxidation resistance protein 1 n=1 Tax=Cyclotella cryptica TaxID=29204 RepID=A0ABD3NS62_9STRA|eukprot:CCRYP_019936-RB/>CCRYP_019936-RB protein AED:0.15 eAED:0.15 QI:209/1/1/1/0.5/0.4/5/3181/757